MRKIIPLLIAIFLLSGCATTIDYIDNFSYESDKVKESVNRMQNAEGKEYFQAIRDKIKTSAYKYYYSGQGIIYLRVILLRNGKIKDLKVYKDKTKTSEELIKLTLKAIKKASPFMPFPNNLKQYPELYYNISLEFFEE